MFTVIKTWLAKKLVDFIAMSGDVELKSSLVDIARPKVPMKNFSFTTTSVREGEDTIDELDASLKVIHKKIRENPVSNLTIGELNAVMEKDLNLPPLTSTFFALNKAMVEITVLEFNSMNVIFNKTTNKVDNIEFTFTDSVNATGSKLSLPAEALTELLTPVIFTKVENHANRSSS